MRALTLSIIFVTISSFLSIPTFASGADPSSEAGFTVTPVSTSDPAVTANGYFIYKVESSKSVTGTILLKNPGTKAVTILLAGVDALTSQTGGSAFETADTAPSGVATWLKFDEPSVTLPAGMQKPVDFTVSVPQSVQPGQYLAGISAYIPNAPPTAGTGTTKTHVGVSLTMQTRYVIGVQVDVAGKWTPSFKVDSVALVRNPSGPFIGVHMKNDGDVFLKPSGTIVMSDASGKRVIDQKISMGTFVPGTDVTYPVKWSGELKPGDYKVTLEMRYGANASQSQTARYDGTVKVENAPTPPKVQKAEESTVGTIGTIEQSQPQPAPASDNRASNLLPLTGSPSGERWLIVLLSGVVLTTIITITVVIVRARGSKAAV